MEDDILGLDSIMSEEDVGAELFGSASTAEEEPEQKTTEEKETKIETQKTTDPTEEEEEVIDEATLFGTPESVGKGQDSKDGKQPSSETTGTSQQNNFYSSITKACKDEGIFPDLEDSEIEAVTDAEKLREVFVSQMKKGIEDRVKRADAALDAGVEVDEIRKFENNLNLLRGIKEENITAEGQDGENLRKNLIYRDFINRGYTKERAIKEVTKSFNAQTDIEDAKEALAGLIQFNEEKYDEMIAEAQKEAEAEKERLKQESEELKKSILDDEKVFGDLSVDKATRQKIFDNISKPVYRDKETGEFMTAIQKYQKDHRNEFLKNLSLVFTLTDGFKNFDGLIGKKVKKEVAKGFQALERKINTTSRNVDGSLNFTSGVDSSQQPLSELGKTWDLL